MMAKLVGISPTRKGSSWLMRAKGPGQQYDVTSDDQRFLVNSIADEPGTPVTMVRGKASIA